MKRISTPTAVQNKFVDGNKSSGLKATRLNAEWFNQVQEELCNLLEAAGITVGESDEQLKKLFTVLHVLEATVKSIVAKKTFTGGFSQTEVDGDKLKLSAGGEAIADNSSLEMTRMLLKYMKSGEGGAVMTEVSPEKVVVKSVGNNEDAILLEITNDGLSFKSGNPATQHAHITYDDSNGTLSIGGYNVSIQDFYSDNGHFNYVYSDFIEPETTNSSTPVTVGSIDGGVQLLGTTVGFRGKVATNEIEPDDSNYPVWIKSVVKAINLPNDFVSVDSITTADPASSRTLLAENLWVVGQVKRFLNTQSTDKQIYIYTDTGSGDPLTVTIPAHCYSEFCCVGFYTNALLDNQKFAVLVKGA